MEKILRRDRINKTLGGVCAGIGKYTATDPVLWKLIFVFGALCPGFPAILIYILMWVIVPEESKEIIEPVKPVESVETKE